MKLIASKTNDGELKGNIAFYCKMLHVSRQGFYKYLMNKDRPKRKPNGITKADREGRKSDDLLKRDFQAAKPLTKCVTDITEIKASNGKLYVSAIFDCFDLSVIGLAMDTNQKTPLCVQTLENAYKAYPALRGAVMHSDRGTQYTSHIYRAAINQPVWNPAEYEQRRRTLSR